MNFEKVKLINNQNYVTVMQGFKENIRKNIYQAIKREIAHGLDFSNEYDWIFNLVIEVNHKYFGLNNLRINIYSYPYQNDSTQNIYDLIRVFIGNYNFFKNQIELIGEDFSKKPIVVEDLQNIKSSF
ncbi:MAG: hypothetical protein U5M51_15595 [Emticicia sp.]|nr:hypothetical protein [Emticicia sp.]